MEYIPLANAHVNQTTSKGVKTDWSIEENKTNKQLGILPKSLNEQEVFYILDLMRKYELEAFNTGITFGKDKQKKADDQQIEHLTNQVRLGAEENERLANSLEAITNKKQ